MNVESQFYDALAALRWQIELGADEALLDEPIDRFASLPEPAPALDPAKTAQPKAPSNAAPPPKAEPEIDVVSIAKQMARAAPSLEALRHALAAFEHCELRLGARNFVFAEGSPDARVMVIGEAPGREEDRQGKPFVGPAGILLDKMFAAIGLARNQSGASGLYLSNMLPWRPPQNRDPKPGELAMMRPFVERHIELVEPELVVLLGNHACSGLLGRSGITRLRGQWSEVLSRPAIPMLHPAYLLRNPIAKREAWADLLSIKSRL